MTANTTTITLFDAFIESFSGTVPCRLWRVGCHEESDARPIRKFLWAVGPCLKDGRRMWPRSAQ